MINTDEVINDLKNRLKTLISNNTLTATCKESTSNSVSFYIYKTPNDSSPLLILRISDHRPNLQSMIRGNTEKRPSEEDNTNLSIEFYKPRPKDNGVDFKKNRFNSKVYVPDYVPEVKPFTFSSFSYTARKLTNQDVEVIYGALLIWLFRRNGNVEYQDPFANTDKKAKVEIKTSEIFVKTKKSQNISVDNDGNYVRANGDGADFVSEKLNHQQVYNLLCECLKKLEYKKGA